MSEHAVIARAGDLDGELTALPPERWPTLVPGDPDHVVNLATGLQLTGANLRQQSRRLVAVDPDTYWKGDAAGAFALRKQQLPPLLDKAEERYHRTADALSGYGVALRDVRQTARNAAREAGAARTAIEAAGYPLADWPRYYGGGQPIMAPGSARSGPPVPIEPHPPVAVGPPVHVRPPQPIEGPIRPPLPVRPPAPVQPPVDVTAEYERFGAAVRLMESAITTYREAARRCAQAIRTASHDTLRDSPTYSADLTRLKGELTQNLAGVAPTMREQIAKLTGVAGLLGWIPIVGMVAGRDRHALAEKLSEDAASWQNGRTDGRTVLDDFLAVLGQGPHTGSTPDVSMQVTRHTVPVVA